MKKRIVSMILALSMVLSILPVSAFADAGAGFSSAAAEETNSITYSSEEEHEAVGKNSETNNQVVKIEVGTNGLPKAASGTGWSYDETTGLTITGTGSEDTEYILDGTVSCNVTVKNANSHTVYLLDGTVTGTLLIEADNMYGVRVLGGSYADVQLNLGTIDGGTYDKLTENGGNVRGGFFRDISGLSADTQQQAHQLLLPENCTLNGQKETKIYIIKKYNYSGNGNDLELVVESDTGCDVWAVASTGGSVMALPAGTQNYAFTYFDSTIATISISADGKTLSASFNMIPAQNGAPMKLVPMALGATELRFNNEGQPDLTDVTYVDSLDTDAKLHRVYMGNGWGYNCYPNDSSNESTLQILNQGGANFDFSALSDVPINCYVEITNANITGGEFGENGRLTITSGKISGGTFHNVSAGINSINGNSAVEITGGTFDSLFCNGSCSIANAVIQSCNFNTYGNNTYTISDTVLGELPDGIQKLLPAGQQLSTLVVRNGGVTAMNGRTLPLSTNTIYLVGAGSAELTLNTDVLSINDAPVENYNANTSADGKVLRITGKNDGAKIFVNKSTDPSDLKPLRITEKGLPDLTGVTGVPMSGEGMTANLYEGLGWKYATMEENGRTRAALYITTPDGNPVDLSSDTINPYHKAIAVEQITFANVTVTGIVAEGSVGAENTIIQDGTFQKDVYMDENSTIAGGTFQDVVRAYGKITGGSFIAEVQLNQNSEVTGGVFHDVQLPSYATEKTVIQNAVILGSLKTDSDSKAAISNTVSCGYIESRFLAAGQQQSKLMIADGTVDAVNGNAVATDAVYLVGNTAVTITFSKAVTNINGKAVSAYDANAQLSADGKTLTLTAKNDGEPIVVNVAASGKLPFSALKESNFTVSGTPEDPIITCDQEGVGKLSLVYVRTYDNKEFDHFPSETEYGSYKVYIRAEEGTLYEGGELLVGEGTRKYRPTSTDFRFDLKNGTASYNGTKYFGDAVPQATLKYSATDDWLTATEKVPTEAGTYYVWLDVKYDDYYDGVVEQLPDRYTVAGKLPFEGFKLEDFKPNANGDGTFTLTSPEGVGKSTLEFKCITGVNKGVTFINEIPDANKFGRYQGTIIAEEGEKYKAGSIVVGQDTVRYTPVVEDFDYDATKNTVEYKGENYYDADPQMTLLYGTDQSETVPTAPGSYDVYVKVTAGKNYIADAYAEDYYRIYQVGTYVVPEQTKPKYYYYWNAQEGMEQNVGDKITLSADKREGYTITWKVEGLAKDAYTIKDTGTHIEIQFTMPANDVRLKSVYEPISYTLTVDGKDELRDFDENVTVTAPEKVGETFTGWEVDGVPEGTDTTKATISFKMPANNVTLTPQYEKNTYTLTVDEKDEPRVFDEDVTVIAQPVEGKTFTGWEVTGLPADVDTTKVTISFTMPANNVTLKAQYTENAPKTYKLDVTDAKVTLKDGGAVADLTAVPVGTELVATAPEKDGYTFTGWEVTGLPADVDTTKATISFTMPANKVTLKAQYKKNNYTLTVDGVDEQRDFEENVTVTAQPVEGKTFTGWEVTGLPADVDTTKVTISFTMPANNVTLKAQYTENAPKTYKLDVTDAKVTLKDGSDVADLTAVPVGTELKATADEDTETSVFKNWNCTGLELTEEQSTARVVYFTMPDHDVNLVAEFVTPTNKLEVTDAKVTLKDGGAVADLTAVPVGTELVATAPEKDGYTFTGWKVTGLSTDVDTTKATISFTMPANNVTLKAQYTENAPKTYKLDVSDATITLKDGGAVADLKAVPMGTELKATADEDTETSVFKSWSCTGLELTEEQSTARVVYFTMPDHDVNLVAEFVTPTNKLDVTDAKVTLKDGGAVADLTAVRVGTELVATAPEKDGYTFTGWEVAGLPTDVDTTKVTISFTMPANNVTLKAQYTENAPKTYKLDVSGAQVTLKDGGAVADLTAVPVGTELKATADEDTETSVFKNWNCTGLELTEEQRTAHEIYFTMPDHDVNLKAEFVTPTNKLDVSGAQVTLKDGGAVADLTAVPVGTELKATADEDTETSVFKNWNCTGLELTEEQRTAHEIYFTMPDHDVNLKAVFEVPATPDPDPTPDPKPDPTPDPDPTPAPGGDSDGGGAAIVAVAAVGGAAIGVGAYIAGTTAYLKSVLPEGMAIPANRQQLAVALWTAAGKPATQSTALFNDVAADAAELQAIRWVVDTGLMSAQDGSFKPGSRVGRMEVIRTWKTYQQRG